MFPLEGVHDYVDLSLIVNPWQAVVAVAVIFALLVWPQLSARQITKRVEKTLTQNNGGGSVKDQMDRIEKVQTEQAEKFDKHIIWSEGIADRVDALEASPKKKGFFR